MATNINPFHLQYSNISYRLEAIKLFSHGSFTEFYQMIGIDKSIFQRGIHNRSLSYKSLEDLAEGLTKIRTGYSYLPLVFFAEPLPNIRDNRGIELLDLDMLDFYQGIYPPNYIGEAIKKYRVALGLKQEDLASISGGNTGQISQYETDTEKPRIATINKLAEALGLVPLYLWSAREYFEKMESILREAADIARLLNGSPDIDSIIDLSKSIEGLKKGLKNNQSL